MTSGWAWHSVSKFAIVGVINTLLTLATIFILKSVAGLSDVPANLGGYLLGLACSFVLNKRWTFEHSGSPLLALGRFLVVFGASYLLNLAVVIGVIRAGASPYWAHLSGMPFYTVAFYFGCRHFAFRTAGPAPTS